MTSISVRLLVGTGIVLAVFVVLTALSVSYSVQQRAEEAVLDRLQGMIYGILGATELVDNLRLEVNAGELPDRRLNQPTSGVYAEIISFEQEPLWQSTSVASIVPPARFSQIGVWDFEKVASPAGTVHDLQLTSVWELPNGEELPFIVHVVSDARNLSGQLRRFDQALWLTLLMSAGLLLIIQLWVLNRSLQPLKQIGAEVDAVERGQRDSLTENVPHELQPLARSINTLLAAERNRHRQYRYLLDDLAHSLKTPLSVLQNLGEELPAEAAPAEPTDGSGASTGQTRQTLALQVEQMQHTLAHYLRRSTMRTPHYLYPAIPLAPVADRVCSSLQRLYRTPEVRFSNRIDTGFSVRIADADLYEILGNLLDNACKYGARQIQLSTAKTTDATGPSPGSQRVVLIDDDGPGFPAGLHTQLTGRGVRADSRVEGHGMGLAACNELMSAYGGSLELGESPLGGAQIRLSFAA